METDEIKKLSEDCLKLKESIYGNKVILKATTEQQDAFYRMVDSFINRIKYHMDSNLNMEHVKNTIEAINMLEETNDRVHVTFLFDKMKDNMVKAYEKYRNGEDKTVNFVAAIEPTIFYPIRIIIEKLYRELFKQSSDTSLDNFFQNKKI